MNHEVKQIVSSAMTAKQVIEMLEDMPPDAPVFFVCSYGDHSRTQQALPVESVEEAEAKYLYDTAYSQSGLALREDQGYNENDEDEDEDEDDEDDCCDNVVILK